jgi:parallel beta-helix repeat protein
MALVIADRLQETTSTSGTGNITLSGPVLGFRSFSSKCSPYDTFWGVIEAVDSSGKPSGEWEIGEYTYINSTTIERTRIYASSNGDKLVNFPAGLKRVFLDVSAEQLKKFNSNSSLPPSFMPFGQDPSQFTALTFHDEFDGTTLDTTKWKKFLWNASDDVVQNFNVANGSLNIWPASGFVDRILNTDMIFYQTYGFFEMEAKLPVGRGCWPTFFLMDHDTAEPYQIIDIMEAYSGGFPGQWANSDLHPIAYGVTAHPGDGSQIGPFLDGNGVDLSAAFHKYAVKWSIDSLVFYFDGQPVMTIGTSHSRRKFIAVGLKFGSASGSPDGTTPLGPANALQINYVRAWGGIPPDLSNPPPTPTTVLPVPTGIVSGATVNLQAGVTYVGTLDLSSKSNVTVKTVGTGSKASITAGKAITGWTVHSGNIYKAPIDFTPVQVSIGGAPIEPAHWPDRPTMWAVAGNSGNNTELIYTPPNADVVGAVVTFKVYEYALEERPVTAYSNGVMTLGNNLEPGGFNNNPSGRQFYLQGKLWMLTGAGEWAVEGGFLYVWAPDGRTPEGRVWAAAANDGINASGSVNCVIDGVRIFSTHRAVLGNNSSNLQVQNCEISNSSKSGILASGSSGLTVNRTTIKNSCRNGIDGFFGSSNATITNNAIMASGVVGMPKHSDGGIYLGGGSGHNISRNSVSNSNYIGIQVTNCTDTTVHENVVDTACIHMTDGGGIYTARPNRTTQTMTISNNTVRGVKNGAGSGTFAIYLDDSANGVTVRGNYVFGCRVALYLHNAFNNIVSNNTFKNSTLWHIKFGENSPDLIVGNRIENNVFVGNPNTLCYNLDSASDVRNFGFFDKNSYTNSASLFARTQATNRSYSDWRTYMGGFQATDVNSTLTPI